MTTKKKNEMELAKTADLLPEGVDFESLSENLSQMDDIEFPRMSFRQGRFYFTDDPDDKGVEEFEGVILAYGNQNTYWKGTYDPRNVVPPDCFSGDGVTGSKARDAEGRYGDCKTCTLNQFGSGQGKGKACRNQNKLYVQVVGQVVPYTLFLAPTSVGAFKQNYVIAKVTQRALSLYQVVTKFGAYKKDKETFWRVKFDVASVFKGEEAEQMKKLREFWLEPIKRDRTRMEGTFTASEEGAEGGDEAAPAPAVPRAAPSSSGGQTRKVEPRKPVEIATSSDNPDEDPPF